MDRFTRIYATVLGATVAVGLALWIASAWQPRVWEINELLASDSELFDYAYKFRVLSLDEGVASISTPRSFQVPAYRYLQIIAPRLASKTQDDPAMIAAQQELVDHQKRAMELVLAVPDVTRVDWELDTRWLAEHGVAVPQSRDAIRGRWTSASVREYRAHNPKKEAIRPNSRFRSLLATCYV